MVMFAHSSKKKVGSVLLVAAGSLLVSGCSSDGGHGSNPLSSSETANESIVGSWAFWGCSDSQVAECYRGASVSIGENGVFVFVNPDLPDGEGGLVDAVAVGSYAQEEGRLVVSITEQSPENSPGCCLAMGENDIAYSLIDGQLVITVDGHDLVFRNRSRGSVTLGG
jgi:hypothetical protein